MQRAESKILPTQTLTVLTVFSNMYIFSCIGRLYIYPNRKNAFICQHCQQSGGERVESGKCVVHKKVNKTNGQWEGEDGKWKLCEIDDVVDGDDTDNRFGISRFRYR